MTSGDKIRYFFEEGAFNDKGKIINTCSSMYCGAIILVISVSSSVDMEHGCSQTRLVITIHMNKLV